MVTLSEFMDFNYVSVDKINDAMLLLLFKSMRFRHCRKEKEDKNGTSHYATAVKKKI